MEGEGCVDQVGVYDEPGASLAMWCYLGTWIWIPMAGKMVIGGGLGCEPRGGGAQGGGAMVAW